MQTKEMGMNMKEGKLVNKWKLAVGYLMILSVLAACGTNVDTEKAGASKKVPSDILYMGLTNAPDSFNPLNTPGVSGRWTQRFFYDGLLEMPEPLTFEPALADSFETEDNQHYTIKLNQKAAWTDGTPITADDVVFTYNLIADPEVESVRGMAVSSLEGTNDVGKREAGLTELPNLVAVDDKTVTLKTKTPVDPNYLKEILGFEIFIVPKHVLKDIPKKELANADFVTQPTVTSGSYKFVDYAKDDHLELVANEEYYKGAPEIKQLFIRIMNGTNLVTEFQSGGIQANAGGGIGVVPIQDVAILKEIDELTVDTNPSYSEQFALLNNDVFADTSIRQAIAHAINRQQIVDSLLKSEGEVLESAYTSASPYKNEDLKPTPYDPEKAKAFIAESDFDMSQEIRLVVPIGNKVREQYANLIEQDLKAVGFNVVQTTYDFPTTLELAQKGEYDLMLMGYAFTVDPDVSTYFASHGASNYSSYNDPESDALLEAGKKATTFEERQEIYNEFQVLWQKEMYVLPLYSDSQFAVKRNELTGGAKEFWAGSLSDISEWTLSGAQ
ncbi:ABC transporter substrate-binding protein [Carnobacterium sp. CS13]|uniref:ABC transporter substrate-binding protein n=1 Tax=Carnobacterium sp. CS13 TaxID=2800128 RepID=UPI0019146202|nr:ABC transporter substrate-binding protein [Carnobacterium sp. CS13]QQP70770.1 ABC transporter substrate-binding protein [Carnobacterium sp. CS13]